MGKRRYPVPAVLLALLAVDETVQGRGYGARLLVHALSEAVTFSAKAGVTLLEDHELHLFMPVKHLLATSGVSH